MDYDMLLLWMAGKNEFRKDTAETKDPSTTTTYMHTLERSKDSSRSTVLKRTYVETKESCLQRYRMAEAVPTNLEALFVITSSS